MHAAPGMGQFLRTVKLGGLGFDPPRTAIRLGFATHSSLRYNGAI